MLDKSGQKLTYVTSGCIRTPKGELAERLKTILDGLAEVIADHGPAQIALEKVFVNANPQSTLLLGQARGTAICAAVLHGLPLAEYTALQVKQAVVGNGHARQGAGAGDGAAAPQARAAIRAPTRPTRSPAPSATRTAGRGWDTSRRPATG